MYEMGLFGIVRSAFEVSYKNALYKSTVIIIAQGYWK